MSGSAKDSRTSRWPKVPEAAFKANVERLAQRVMAGDVVEADLTDGTFVALMDELKRLGYQLIKRDERVKELKPFLFHVAKSTDRTA